MFCEIITIGNEILDGNTVNTNSSHLAKELNAVGINVRWMTTVADEIEEILRAFRVADERANFCIITGGLGPTHDDITHQAICSFLDTQLRFEESVMSKLQDFYKRRGVDNSSLPRTSNGTRPV